jgi:hypothetical protein
MGYRFDKRSGADAVLAQLSEHYNIIIFSNKKLHVSASVFPFRLSEFVVVTLSTHSAFRIGGSDDAVSRRQRKGGQLSHHARRRYAVLFLLLLPPFVHRLFVVTHFDDAI